MLLDLSQADSRAERRCRMRPKPTALLIGDHADEFFETACAIFETMSVRTIRLKLSKEAANYLAASPPPHVVLADTALVDTTWEGIVDLARKTPDRVNVIVASRVADLPLYLDVMSGGAYDFVTHASTVPELVHIFQGALVSAARSRAPKADNARPANVHGPLEPTPTV